MTEEELKKEMLRLAKEKGLTATENFDKIVRAKVRFGVGLGCPCDRNNPDRHCISEQCLKDVEENGTCLCRCWKKEKEDA